MPDVEWAASDFLQLLQVVRLRPPEKPCYVLHFGSKIVPYQSVVYLQNIRTRYAVSCIDLFWRNYLFVSFNSLLVAR